MGSMQYFIIQNSLSGVFNVEDKEMDGLFTRMFIKSLKGKWGLIDIYKSNIWK